MDAHPAERNTSPFDLPAKPFVRAWITSCLIGCVILFFAFVFNKTVTDAGQAIWDFLHYLASPLFGSDFSQSRSLFLS